MSQGHTVNLRYSSVAEPELTEAELENFGLSYIHLCLPQLPHEVSVLPGVQGRD